MATQKPALAKGTRDFGPKEVQKRKYILNTIEAVFKKFGFMPLETPAMENLTTLEGKYGDEGDKLLFRILDSGKYFEAVKQKVDSNYTTEINDFTYNFFKEFILKVIKEDLIYNPHKFIEEYKNSTKSPVIRERFGKKIGDTISRLLRVNFQNKVSTEIQRMIKLSGLAYDFNDEDFEFQMKNFKTNLLDEITIEILSKIDKINRKLAGLNSKQISKFISEKGLRYDLTVPFARYVVMNRNDITFPFKRYQMQPVWRADRPQKGRYREFWQCDADVVGSDSLLNEVDLIQIYAEAFSQLQIPYQIKLNNRKVLAGIAEVVKSVDEMNTIATAIDKLDKIGEAGVKAELTNYGYNDSELNTLFKIISLKGNNEAILQELKSLLINSDIGSKGIEELQFVLRLIPNLTPLVLDFSLARGLSYYTGCIIEVAATEGSLKSSIGGGGRYDNLTGIFGLPNVSGVGISFGLDRIYDVMEELNLFPNTVNRASSTQVLFCHFDEATQEYCLPALKALREAGIAAEVYPDVVRKKTIAKQLDYANALNIPFAAIAGETEMQQHMFNVKNLQTGEQTLIGTEELIRLINPFI